MTATAELHETIRAASAAADELVATLQAALQAATRADEPFAWDFILNEIPAATEVANRMQNAADWSKS